MREYTVLLCIHACVVTVSNKSEPFLGILGVYMYIGTSREPFQGVVRLNLQDFTLLVSCSIVIDHYLFLWLSKHSYHEFSMR